MRASGAETPDIGTTASDSGNTVSDSGNTASDSSIIHSPLHFPFTWAIPYAKDVFSETESRNSWDVLTRGRGSEIGGKPRGQKGGRREVKLGGSCAQAARDFYFFRKRRLSFRFSPESTTTSAVP